MLTILSGFSHLTCSLVLASSLPACYEPAGLVPEARQVPAQKLWTDEQVDAVVEVTYLTIDGGEPVESAGAPDSCDQVSFLRFRHAQGPQEASDADAAFLMVPGVLEGANGFEFIGRQLVYMAQQEYGKHVEVWGMDRRSNCLEDLTGMHAAAQAPTADEAGDIIVDYYYQGMPIDGQVFAGFRKSSELPFLAEFGLRQTTLDMHAIVTHMMPERAVRQEKLFVGGHSLGGAHTSVYLSWDFDGNPDTQGGAGYHQVAGAFALDSQVATLDSGRFADEVDQNASATFSEEVMNWLADPGQNSDWGYRFNLMLLRSGIVPRNAQIPGFFTSEVLALPQVLGILAAKAPDEESTIYDKAPISPALNNIINTVHSNSPATIGNRPLIDDFRYTNEALVGLMFDDNFQILAFLKAGLGFMDGGPLTRKWEGALEFFGDAGGPLLGSNDLYIAGDAGPDHKNFGQGPLYRWVSRGEMGSAPQDTFTDTSGEVVFTTVENEPVNMADFVRALHTGPTNLTEWYFPLRIMLDLPVVNKPYAASHGLMTVHPQGPALVPSIVLNGARGVSRREVGDMPLQTTIIAPGYNHMDPMFEAVNAPGKTSYVMRPLLEFAFMVMEE